MNGFPHPHRLAATVADRLALRWTAVVARRPWWAIAAVLVVVGLASTGLPKLGFSNNYRSYFGPANPELLAFEELQATYSKSDNILFVLRPGGGEVFTSRVLAAVEQLTEEAWTVPYASRVDSITNFQHSWANGDELTVEDLVTDALALSPAEIAGKRSIALAEPLLVGSLLSRDANATGVNVVLQFPEESLAEVPAAVEAARRLARQIEQELSAPDGPGVEIALTGVTLLNHAFTEAGQRDAGTLMPLMFAGLTLFLAIMLRSLWGILATLGVVGLSATTALGLAGHLGIELSPVAVNAPTVIMTLAVADSIHLMISMLAAMRGGAEQADALAESVRVNFVAVTITSLTTMIGFLALNFSDTPPFRDLGNITALGIAAAFVFSLTLPLAMLTLFPVRVRSTSGAVPRRPDLRRRLDRLALWIRRRRPAVLAVSLAAAVGTIACLPRLELDDQWVDYFDERIEFRRHADFADEHLTGLYPVELSVPAGRPEGINEPEYLATLERFTAWLREQPEVRHVTSYADVIRRLNMNLHGDDPRFYRVPVEAELAAQYLLLYELSLPYGLDLNDRIAVDKSATRVTATLGDRTARETRAFLSRAERWLQDHAPQSMHTVASGPPVMFAHISQRNIESMLRGNVLAVLLIAGILMIALRSAKLGLLSLIPNTLPVLATFGVWALVAGRVGMAAAMVSVTSLGIIVDDTVHFLAKYQRARREGGLDPAGAVRFAMRTVGEAMIATTAVLTIGFAALALSTFRINFELGILTAIAIVLALATDLLVLPALLLWRLPAESEETAKHDAVPA